MRSELGSEQKIVPADFAHAATHGTMFMRQKSHCPGLSKPLFGFRIDFYNLNGLIGGNRQGQEAFTFKHPADFFSGFIQQPGRLHLAACPDHDVRRINSA